MASSSSSVETEAPTTTTSSLPSGSNEPGKAHIQPIAPPRPEDIYAQDFNEQIWFRSSLAGVMGGGMGLIFGIFLGSLDNPITQDQMGAKKQFIYTAKQMGTKSLGFAKNFALMGFVFSAAEGVMEKTRAKHDITNSTVAGCVTGGVLAAKGGPQAACLGCAGFAAFSYVIDKFIQRH
ncbi:hypothetical protein IFM89_006095 [Coptis chinensis]|uniref:Mitochondrial import inner membrane translocase subunit TIM22 n=1 Tax=Coptis chinensis TaxID=261450 RepID=A0A835GVZ9_9MAGN|nr:hypothetical protein IFM89_006095 [Coptis chinensis]